MSSVHIPRGITMSNRCTCLFLFLSTVYMPSVNFVFAAQQVGNTVEVSYVLAASIPDNTRTIFRGTVGVFKYFSVILSDCGSKDCFMSDACSALLKCGQNTSDRNISSYQYYTPYYRCECWNVVMLQVLKS